ncbi:MAG: hypothetical protein HY959_03480 [Ignavibacteriae bacterium]|nr:hypothetical protein [Ignavibacteriota bacterium]
MGPGVRVCSIKIINCKGDEILNEIIYAENFIIPGYNEKFYKINYPHFLELDGTALAVSPNLGSFDIQIYWYNECDMWIDYVKVENEVADKLLSNDPQNNFDPWIQWEADNIGGENGALRLSVDEPDYNMLPCVKYVQDMIISQNYKISLIVNEYSYGIDPSQNNYLDYSVYEKKLDGANLPEVLTASYPQRDKMAIPYNLQPEDYNPDNGFLGIRTYENVYEPALQDTLDNVFIKWSEKGLKYAKLHNKNLYFVPQVHLYKTGGIPTLREPTNEEIEAMTDIMISYGAKGIFYYCYNSWNEFDKADYCRGLTSYLNPHTPLYNNVYGQPKWSFICTFDEKLQTWGPTLMSLPIANTNSYSYRLEEQRNQLISNSYFYGITTFKLGNDIPLCNEDNVPPGVTYDCPDERYLQVATMKNSEPNTEYFMIVNRRCFVDPQDNNPHKFGARSVRVFFKPNHPSFTGFNNWSIVNIENGSVVGTFNKNNYSYVNLSIENDDYNGWFKPGEGRLYKIVPTYVSGGTLVCDENIQGVNITCNNLVTATDKNINIGFSTTINFTQNARFEFTGGTFSCGDVNQPTHEKNIIFQSPLDWNGITLNSCNLVNINSAKFEKVKGELQNTNYALKLFDCFTMNINNCTFTNYQNQKSGAIESNYNSTATTEPNIYIAGNIFDMNSSDKRALSIMSFASGNVPVRIYNNNFTSNSNSATAIYLSFVTGVAVCDNVITGFNKGAELIETNIDFYNNVITSVSGNNLARSVDATVNSVVNMSSNGNYITGGRNTFDNTNNYAANIYVNNSTFLLDYGINNFNIMPNSNSLHLSGYFPGEGTDAVQYERKNCFKLNNSPIVEPNLPLKEVKWLANNNDVEFEFFPYECAGNSSNTDIVIDVGNYVFDTIQYSSGGTGGGFGRTQTVSPKTIYDSVCILMRLRNYVLAKAKCYELLNLFPDSLHSLNSISKLYQLAVTLDTSLTSANNCKTYLNTLILNHPNNLQLVRKCNYYIRNAK